jgi:hypothetical protein
MRRMRIIFGCRIRRQKILYILQSLLLAQFKEFDLSQLKETFFLAAWRRSCTSIPGMLEYFASMRAMDGNEQMQRME